MLLEVENLNVYYGAIHALQGVSFNVEEGEIVTLIGANGAGKSTTLRTISGLLRSRGGQVKFKGMDISMMPAQQIVRLGASHVPEGRKIFAPLTVKENLMMGAFTRSDPAEIQRSMDRVFSSFPRLKERIGQLGGTLSGGEQQMLATGRGMMSRPTLMMMDEPSMGLQPNPGGRDFLDHQGDQCPGHQHPAGRAECLDGVVDLTPGLCAGNWTYCPFRHRQRDRGKSAGEVGVSGDLSNSSN